MFRLYCLEVDYSYRVFLGLPYFIDDLILKNISFSLHYYFKWFRLARNFLHREDLLLCLFNLASDSARVKHDEWQANKLNF